MTKYKQDPQHEGLYLPLPGVQHYCAPAHWETGGWQNRQSYSGWVLVKETVTRIAGNSGWTTQDPNNEPEVIAYRKQSTHVWYKGRPSGYIRIETTRRENIEHEEVVAMLLMARKA